MQSEKIDLDAATRLVLLEGEGDGVFLEEWSLNENGQHAIGKFEIYNELTLVKFCKIVKSMLLLANSVQFEMMAFIESFCSKLISLDDPDLKQNCLKNPSDPSVLTYLRNNFLNYNLEKAFAFLLANPDLIEIYLHLTYFTF